MLPRADVRDRLVGAYGIDMLPLGARVGTSSPRRSAQLLRHRPDLAIVPLRGNVATRLAKLERGDADAIILAAAGLDRLGQGEIGTPIETDEMLPAPAQGAIGVEVRADDTATGALVKAIGHRPTQACVATERRLLKGLGGDCRTPIAALAEWIAEERVRLRAEIWSSDGRDGVALEREFEVEHPDAPEWMAAEMLRLAEPRLKRLFGR
jgi:hydroxymethylbilane synthase